MAQTSNFGSFLLYLDQSLEDGTVHNYFSPYESPYEAFISYANALNDFQIGSKKDN